MKRTFFFITCLSTIFNLVLPLKILASINPSECNSTMGLIKPIEVCSPQNICNRPLVTYRFHGRKTISEISDVPDCKTKWPSIKKHFLGVSQGGRGVFNDGPAKKWIDPQGIPRYWCAFIPKDTSEKIKKPLIIYIPGSGGSADNIYDFTSLRKKAIDYDFSSDGKAKGFILISVQGRNLHWPTVDAQDGSKFDSYHRNLATNPDVLFLDYLIDHMVTELKIVNPKQIYLTGWSNGARFATFYGINRSRPPSPKVTAVAVYSGGDPLENISSTQSPSCKQETYPETQLPYFLISRNCDLIACDQNQFDFFIKNKWNMTPGNQATTWISNLKNKMKNKNTFWTIIDESGNKKNNCLEANLCHKKVATRNHFCWPDGISDGSGIDYEIELLNFFKKH